MKIARKTTPELARVLEQQDRQRRARERVEKLRQAISEACRRAQELSTVPTYPLAAQRAALAVQAALGECPPDTLQRFDAEHASRLESERREQRVREIDRARIGEEIAALEAALAVAEDEARPTLDGVRLRREFFEVHVAELGRTYAAAARAFAEEHAKLRAASIVAGEECSTISHREDGSYLGLDLLRLFSPGAVEIPSAPGHEEEIRAVNAALRSGPTDESLAAARQRLAELGYEPVRPEDRKVIVPGDGAPGGAVDVSARGTSIATARV